MKHLVLPFALGVCLSAGASFAAPPEPVQQFNSGAIWFENWKGLSGASLTVKSPLGQKVTVQAKSETPVFYLESMKAVDGVYNYELRAATEEEYETFNELDNGREKISNRGFVPYVTTGFFFVERGVIIRPEEVVEADKD